MPDKITKSDIDLLSNNSKLQELIQEISTCSFPYDHFTELVKIDRAVKGLKDRAKTGKLDSSQAGEGYLDDVNVPIAFLILDTLTAQMADIFFDRSNIFTYLGVTSDDMKGAEKATLAVNAGLRKLGSVKDMKTAMRNGFKHGYSINLLHWDSLVNNKVTTFDDNDGQGPQRGYVPTKVLSGCKVSSIPVYQAILDRSVPPDRIQKGRWCGHWEKMSRNDIIRNYGVTLDDMDWSWLFAHSNNISGLADLFELNNMGNKNTIVAHLYVDIIPSEYGLKGDEPEVWYLVLAGRDRILKANRVRLPIDKYPYYTAVPDGDGYDPDPISRIALVLDLIAEYNWLHNSHMYAVRKGLDADLVVDPSLIDMTTVENRDADRKRNVFLVAEGAQGLPGAVREGLFVIPNTNDTDGYAQESGLILDTIKVISGATDPLIGSGDNPSSRRTAEEIASTKKSASQRLLQVAGNLHDGFMLPLGTAALAYTQHYLDHDVFLRLTKDPLEEPTSISPPDLEGMFDTEVGDEFLTLDKTAIVNSWQTLISTIFQNPNLIQSFNLVEVLSEFGKAMGIKDIKRFISQAGTAAVKTQAVEQNLAQLPQMTPPGEPALEEALPPAMGTMPGPV